MNNRNPSNSIDYIMFFLLPGGYTAGPAGENNQYRLSDPSGKIKVQIRFEGGDRDRFTFYIDETGPVSTQTQEQAAAAIRQDVEQRQEQWIRGSELRREKLQRLSRQSRLQPHLESRQPMAYITADLPTATDPQEVKLRRLQLLQTLDKLNGYGFGYHLAQRGQQAGFVLYGEPRRAQLLKQLVIACGRRFGQNAVEFCDENAVFSAIDPESGAESPCDSWEDMTLSREHTPYRLQTGTSRLFRFLSFQKYYLACLDEENRVYRFDHRLEQYL